MAEKIVADTVTAKTFTEVMSEGAQPTLKAIAEVLGVPQQRLYSVAKQPVAGQIYDARVYNWDAISKFISKRIGKEGDEFATMEDVYHAALERDEELAASDKRRGSHGSTKVMIDLGEGKSMPGRRKNVSVGNIVKIKDCDESLEVVYVTDTHVVLKPFGNPTLTTLSNWTFNQKIKEVLDIAVEELTEVQAAE